MYYRIKSEECIECGLCLDICPCDAVRGDGENIAIDASLCSILGETCGLCLYICPVEAIEAVREDTDPEEAVMPEKKKEVTETETSRAAENVLPGDICLYDGMPGFILDYQHVKLGRGPLQMVFNWRDLSTGEIKSIRIDVEKKMTVLHPVARAMEYQYFDGEQYCFMDPETFEELSVRPSQLIRPLEEPEEGGMCSVSSCRGIVFEVHSWNR